VVGKTKEIRKRMSKPKILLWNWGRRGGGPRYTFELARAMLASREMDVHLSLSRQCEIYPEFAALSAPRWDVDTYNNLASGVLNSLRLPVVRRDFWRYVETEKFDLIVGTMSHLWNMAVLAGWRKRPPYLMVLHDAAPHPGDNFFLRHWWLRREIAQAQGVVTLTEHVRHHLCEQYGYPSNKTWVIPHGVFPYATNSPPRKDGPLRLLFFGRILPYKGLDILLHAYALMRGRGVDVRLHIAGPGNLKPYVSQLSTLYGVTVDNRWIPEEEIGSIIGNADVSVLPYREASQSGVIAASYAGGVPVVTTPIGGLVEQVRHEYTGLICDAATPQALADSLMRMTNDQALRVRCAHGAARAAKEAFAWPAIARRFTQVTQNLLALPNSGNT
jgi:glycosyltransferase involved in cell wall biosynthesis